MSINNNFPFEIIKEIKDKNQEILPFIQGYNNLISPNENIQIIPKNIIPLSLMDIIVKSNSLESNKTSTTKQQVPIAKEQAPIAKEQTPIAKQEQLQSQEQPQKPQEPPLPIATRPIVSINEETKETKQQIREKEIEKQEMERNEQMNKLRQIVQSTQKIQINEEKKQETTIINPSILQLVNTSNVQAISNPVNILAMERSNITTNPFIPNKQKIQEFEMIDNMANEIIKKAYEKNDIYNYSINDISKKISSSFIGFLDELFIKPPNENWFEYLQVILLKEDRYVYFGFVLILFVIFMKFIE
jgi:hypothetical protein